MPFCKNLFCCGNFFVFLMLQWILLAQRLKNTLTLIFDLVFFLLEGGGGGGRCHVFTLLLVNSHPKGYGHIYALNKTGCGGNATILRSLMMLLTSYFFGIGIVDDLTTNLIIKGTQNLKRLFSYIVNIMYCFFGNRSFLF